MDKENHACWRLGSKDHTEFGDEIMCSMPETTGSNESSACDSQGENQKLFLRNPTIVGATVAASYVAFIVAYLLMSHIWDEDEIRLHLLDTLIKVFQAIARLFGSWALECERSYNEYVNTLH